MSRVAARSGDVTHLNTRSFASTALDYANHIRTFEQICANVDNALGTLLDSWQGPGREAFRTDMTQICQCLTDVHETMCVLKKTLDDASDVYSAADREVSSAFRG